MTWKARCYGEEGVTEGDNWHGYTHTCLNNIKLKKVPKIKIQENSQISPCKVLKIKWYHAKVHVLLKMFHLNGSHHKISFTDSKVKTRLHVSIIDSKSDRVILIYHFCEMLFQKPAAEEKKEEKSPSPAKKAKSATAAAATGGADVKEIVFSFDTTGSMYPCLTQVGYQLQKLINIS